MLLGLVAVVVVLLLLAVSDCLKEAEGFDGLNSLVPFADLGADEGLN